MNTASPEGCVFDLGIDVGGTFTDVVMIDPNGSIQVVKGPTTPEDQSVGAEETAARLGRPFSEARSIIHGTTVATNAILERRGAKLALITTKGFRDVLELQRQDRSNIWDLYIRQVDPVVPRKLRFEVIERMRADGTVAEALDDASLERVIDALGTAQVEAVAISFLNAYANPVHEEQAEEAVRAALPNVYVTRSSTVAPHFREYERTSTSTISGYVGPKVTNYLDRFCGRFEQRGFKGSIFVMGSNGGVLPVELAGRLAGTTCLSGPAGGVLASQRLARDKALNDVISFDMGGTSTDVCVVRNQEALVSTSFHIDGLPITLPMFSIESVSAGGGSIASIDAGGMLKVGPRSAGSQPGPVCYGLGGTEPTVTDALCVLNLLQERSFFGGEMQLSREPALRAYDELARSLVDRPEPVAAKVLKLANVKMANAVRLITVREGLDTRDFSLVAFGGAGPLHACGVAEELGINRVVVPRFPGAFSAVGLLSANLRRDYMKAFPQRLSDVNDEKLRDAFTRMREEAAPEMVRLAAGRRVFWEFRADVRYLGQASELMVALPGTLSRLRTRTLARRFHSMHKAKYGYYEKHAELEIVNLRVTGFVVVEAPQFPFLPNRSGRQPRRESGSTHVPGAEQCSFLRRDALGAGDELAGPCVVTEPTATTFVPPQWRLIVDGQGHLDLGRLE